MPRAARARRRAAASPRRIGAHRRVRDARGRRQGEGAQGGRAAGDRVRRRRAGLPDPGLHRRGGGRGLPRPAATTATPRPAACPSSRQAIAEKTLRDSGYEVEPAQVLVTNGGKQAIYEAFATMLDPGDEVHRSRRRTGRPTPRRSGSPAASRSRCWPTRPRTTRSPSSSSRRRAPSGPRCCCSLPVQPDRRRLHRRARSRRSAAGRSSTACGCSPTRSTSTWSTTASTTASLPVAVPELADRCVVVNGVAKTYAMTGWRVGWMIGPKDVVKAATNLQSHATSNVSNVAQRAALAAVSGDLSAVAEMREAFDRRRQTIVRDAQRDRRASSARSPTGAFYAYPSVKGAARQGDRRAHAADVGRAGRAHPRRGRGRGRARARRSARRATCGCPTRSGDDDLVEGVTRLQKLLRLSGGLGRTGATASAALPKAHLHLHFTGSMRHATLLELADARRHRAARRAGRATGRRGCRPPTRRAGSASSGSTTSRGRCCAPRTTYAGWCCEAAEDDVARRRPLAGDPGRPERVRRRGSAGSPRSPTWCSTRCATPSARDRPRAWRW